jgi:uncharacterized protein
MRFFLAVAAAAFALTKAAAAPASGPSFDCARAATAGERLVCGDPALSAADSKMSAAYSALRKTLSPEGFSGFQTAQRVWLSYAVRICTSPLPPDENSTDTPTDCLEDTYGSRAALMAGVAVLRSDGLVLEPRMRFHTRNVPPTEETDIYPFLSGGSQAVPFNTFISKSFKLDSWRMDDKSLFRYGTDIPFGEKLHARRTYSVMRLDRRIVSLKVSVSDFVGGHDEEPGDTALTWDLANSKAVSLSDVFAKNTDWKKFVIAYATSRIKKHIADDNVTADPVNWDLSASVADSSRWLWGKDKATVMFTVFMLYGMGDRDYDVDIPYSALKTYMKPDSPVR